MRKTFSAFVFAAADLEKISPKSVRSRILEQSVASSKGLRCLGDPDVVAVETRPTSSGKVG